jgi:hypothetical protein
LCWEDTNDWIDLVALSAKEPILFYEEVWKWNKWFIIYLDTGLPLPGCM